MIWISKKICLGNRQLLRKSLQFCWPCFPSGQHRQISSGVSAFALLDPLAEYVRQKIKLAVVELKSHPLRNGRPESFNVGPLYRSHCVAAFPPDRICQLSSVRIRLVRRTISRFESNAPISSTASVFAF